MSRQQHIYEFESFRLDVAERLLQRDGEVVPLQPKVFDLLLALVERHGRLLEKDELMKLVWPDAVVEEANLANNISILRKTLVENGQQFIETVPKRGYRFVAEVRELNGQPEVDADASTPAAMAAGRQAAPSSQVSVWGVSRWFKRRPALAALLLLLLSAGVIGAINSWPMNRQPAAPAAAINSLAVLPFRPLTAESRDEALELGLADSLIFKLSGLKELIVRPVSAVRKYINPDQDPLAAGREQKVDFVLDSSYQRDGQTIRVRSRLLRVADGVTVWKHECDEQYCANLFVMQDAISAKVVTGLSMRLTGAESARLTRHDTENREAYLLYLHGQFHVDRRTKQGFEKGIEYFQKAIKLDPNYALPYTGLGEAYQAIGQSTLPKEMMPKAKAAIEKALELDGQLAEAYNARGAIKSIYLKTDPFFDGLRSDPRYIDLLRRINLEP